LENGGVLSTDLDIVDPEDIVCILELALEAGLNGVLLVAKSISDQALSVLLNPPNWEKVKILVVKTPGNFADTQLPSLRDLSILTGGRVVFSQTHMRLKDITLDDFGAARKIWANADTFGITTGKGDPRLLRDYVADLQSAWRSAEKVDDQEKLLKRVGRLRGGSATLWIGALTEQDYEHSKETAERTSRALRAALTDGVVPGGGCALLSCRQILEEKHHQAVDLDERAAYRILSRSVQEPFRVLMENAGYQSGEILQKVELSNFNQVFDLRTRSFVNPFATGLVDAAGVVRESIHSAVSSAALLLTTDVLVHLKNPPERINT
jgi:chaperonin GroEL